MESRRSFIVKSALGAGSLAFGMSASSYARIKGANDRVNIGIMGCGRRVGGYYDSLHPDFNAQLSYVCDVKKSQITKVMNDLDGKLDYTPETTDDIRKVLDDSSVDAVLIAAPDHWHAPASWMAMDAGKHVYVEKPCGHNPREGELLVHFQKKYGKLVQMGNQQRSAPRSIEIINDIHNGIIGRPYKAVAFYTNGRGEVPVPRAAEPPADLNWELFQGPAPREAYRHNTWDYNWHWYGWKWGTAETGNNATHELDIARWALGVDYPERVVVDAAKEHFPDDGWEMYDTMYATFQFADGKMISWDGKSRNNYPTYGTGRGTIIYGTEGSVYVDRGEFRQYDRTGKLVREGKGDGDEQGTALGGGGSMSTRHLANFYNAIRGVEKLNSPIDEGAKSTLLCHLANISYRIGRNFDVNPDTGHIRDPEGMALWSREYEKGWEPKL